MNQDETDVVIEYTYTPGYPAQTYGPAENCYPAELDHVEIDQVWMHDVNGMHVLVTLGAAEIESAMDFIYNNHDHAWACREYEYSHEHADEPMMDEFS